MSGDFRIGSWISIGASYRSLGWWRSWRRSWICYRKKLYTQLLALLPTLLCTVLCTHPILSTTTLPTWLLLPVAILPAILPASIPTSRVPSPIVSFFSPFLTWKDSSLERALLNPEASRNGIPHQATLQNTAKPAENTAKKRGIRYALFQRNSCTTARRPA